MVDRASLQDPSISTADKDDKPPPYSEQPATPPSSVQPDAPPPYSEQQLGYLAPSPNQAQPGPYTRQIYHGVSGGGFPAAEPGAFIVQPVQPSLQAPPPDYHCLSWFSCLCCCWPVGAMAILRSNEVHSALARGDYSSAQVASDSARRLALLAVGLGVGILVGNFILWTVVYAILWAR